jgi:hypothetical protein
MQDLDVAKKRLKEDSLTLTVAKNGSIIFETASHGVSGFLEAIEEFGDRLEGASVADRVVGKAIALLCIYTKIKAVYAMTLSKTALAVLEENGVYHESNELVENILDTNKTELCPFEKLATRISSSKDAYERLKALQTSLRCNGRKWDEQRTRTVYIRAKRRTEAYQRKEAKETIRLLGENERNEH